MSPNAEESLPSRKRRFNDSFSEEENSDSEHATRSPLPKRSKTRGTEGFQFFSRAFAWMADWAQRLVTGRPLTMNRSEEDGDGERLESMEPSAQMSTANGHFRSRIPSQTSPHQAVRQGTSPHNPRPLTLDDFSSNGDHVTYPGHMHSTSPTGVYSSRADDEDNDVIIVSTSPPASAAMSQAFNAGYSFAASTRGAASTTRWEDYMPYDPSPQPSPNTQPSAPIPGGGLGKQGQLSSTHSSTKPNPAPHRSISSNPSTQRGSVANRKDSPAIIVPNNLANRSNVRVCPSLARDLSTSTGERVRGAFGGRSSPSVYDRTFSKESITLDVSGTPGFSKKTTLEKAIEQEEKRKYQLLLSRYSSLPFRPRLDRALASLHSKSPPNSGNTPSASLPGGLHGSASVGRQSRGCEFGKSVLSAGRSTLRSKGSTDTRPDLDGSYLGQRKLPAESKLSVKSSVEPSSSLGAVPTPQGNLSPRASSPNAAGSRGPVNREDIINWIDRLTLQYKTDNLQKQREIIEAKNKAEVIAEWRLHRDEDLERRAKYRLKLVQPILPDVPYEEEQEEGEEEFPELSSEAEQMVNAALSGPYNDPLTDKFRLRLTRHDLETLCNTNWLNDEVINYYMSLLNERGEEGGEGLKKVYAFNTFFYPKLLGTGHSAVRRWTRKMDLFSYDLVLIPVHLQIHWCMAAINFTSRTVMFLDSMGSRNNQCLEALLEYLRQESKEKKKSEFDTSNWTKSNVKGLPQQENGSDCGVFACKYAEYLSRGADITFTQEHMPYFRRRMIYEILAQKLM